MKTKKLILTENEIELLISALDEKSDKLKSLHLNDKSRIINIDNLISLLQSHL